MSESSDLKIRLTKGKESNNSQVETHGRRNGNVEPSHRGTKSNPDLTRSNRLSLPILHPQTHPHCSAETQMYLFQSLDGCLYISWISSLLNDTFNAGNSHPGLTDTMRSNTDFALHQNKQTKSNRLIKITIVIVQSRCKHGGCCYKENHWRITPQKESGQENYEFEITNVLQCYW